MKYDYFHLQDSFKLFSQNLSNNYKKYFVAVVVVVVVVVAAAAAAAASERDAKLHRSDAKLAHSSPASDKQKQDWLLTFVVVFYFHLIAGPSWT